MSFVRVLGRIFHCKLMQYGFATAYPYYVTMILTHRCNSRCSMCFIWKMYADNPELVNEELSLSELDLLFKKIPEPLWLTFSGGEPILREDLLDICELAHKHYPHLHGLGVLTNGLCPEKFVRFTKNLLEVGFRNVKASVSIDGTEEMNDKIRGVKGSYKKAIKTYAMLRQIANQRSDFTVVISRTVTPTNAGTLRFFESKAINDLYISIAQNGIAFNNLNCEFNINKRGVLSDINFLLANANFKGIYKKLKKLFVKKCRDFINSPRMVLPCSAFTASCVINPYGEVYPCTIWAKKMGSLRESTFEQIWTSPLAEAVRQSIKREACPICWSGCESTHSLLQAMLSLKAPKLMYEMIR